MSRKILLIEDTPVLAQSISEMLQMEGFIVKVCASGQSALMFLEEHTVDLVITDLKMPQMDGLEITRTIRNTANTKMIPVIILTADTDSENQIRSKEAGANLLLNKPFDEVYLLECINEITTGK